MTRYFYDYKILLKVLDNTKPPVFAQIHQCDHGNSISEIDRIKEMMRQSTSDFDPSEYDKNYSTGLESSTYVCFRCECNGQHCIYMCPFKGGTTSQDNQIKRSTGIPQSFMIKVDDPNMPGAYKTNTGYAVPAIDAVAYAQGKKERPPFLPNETREEQEPAKPEDFLCLLCSNIMTDAVVIPCCGNSYCDECIRNALLESEEHICPTCGESEISPDRLIPNRFLRTAISNFYNETGTIVETTRVIAPPVIHAQHNGPGPQQPGVAPRAQNCPPITQIPYMPPPRPTGAPVGANALPQLQMPPPSSQGPAPPQHLTINTTTQDKAAPHVPQTTVTDEELAKGMTIKTTIGFRRPTRLESQDLPKPRGPSPHSWSLPPMPPMTTPRPPPPRFPHPNMPPPWAMHSMSPRITLHQMLPEHPHAVMLGKLPSVLLPPSPRPIPVFPSPPGPFLSPGVYAEKTLTRVEFSRTNKMLNQAKEKQRSWSRSLSSSRSHTPPKRSIRSRSFSPHQSLKRFSRSRSGSPVRSSLKRFSRSHSKSPLKKRFSRSSVGKNFSKSPNRPHSLKRPPRNTGIKKLSRSPSARKLSRSPNSKRFSKHPGKKDLPKSPERKKLSRSPDSKRMSPSSSKKRTSQIPDKEILSRRPSNKRLSRSPSKKRLSRSPLSRRSFKSPSRKRSKSPTQKMSPLPPRQRSLSPRSRRRSRSPPYYDNFRNYWPPYCSLRSPPQQGYSQRHYTQAQLWNGYMQPRDPYYRYDQHMENFHQYNQDYYQRYGFYPLSPPGSYGRLSHYDDVSHPGPHRLNSPPSQGPRTRSPFQGRGLDNHNQVKPHLEKRNTDSSSEKPMQDNNKKSSSRPQKVETDSNKVKQGTANTTEEAKNEANTTEEAKNEGTTQAAPKENKPVATESKPGVVKEVEEKKDKILSEKEKNDITIVKKLPTKRVAKDKEAATECDEAYKENEKPATKPKTEIAPESNSKLRTTARSDPPSTSEQNAVYKAMKLHELKPLLPSGVEVLQSDSNSKADKKTKPNLKRTKRVMVVPSSSKDENASPAKRQKTEPSLSTENEMGSSTYHKIESKLEPLSISEMDQLMLDPPEISRWKKSEERFTDSSPDWKSKNALEKKALPRSVIESAEKVLSQKLMQPTLASAVSTTSIKPQPANTGHCVFLDSDGKPKERQDRKLSTQSREQSKGPNERSHTLSSVATPVQREGRKSENIHRALPRKESVIDKSKFEPDYDERTSDSGEGNTDKETACSRESNVSQCQSPSSDTSPAKKQKLDEESQDKDKKHKHRHSGQKKHKKKHKKKKKHKLEKE
ncbi:hypothetical protein CHS0354_025112 [Potamilus streckersoni]|uniref:RING-type domain-containing protein n=1 Tax=Potamilus streckersoni TaxID=2493646 RepID=A0AAE0SAL2_9BIVA|nr:hypothetical protein CHS0354_025112 [Potamilus streckersoni]